jgi:transposase
MVVTPKTKRKELTEAARSKIWTLYLEGYNPSQIHVKTGTPRSTINGVIARQTLCPDSRFKSKPRSGRPQKISQRGARSLVRTAISEPKMTLEALSTPSKSGKKLNHHTVAIVLKSFGKAKRRPRKKPFLNTLHKKKRREHCRAEKAMGRDNRRVCWSDEVTFIVGENL